MGASGAAGARQPAAPCDQEAGHIVWCSPQRFHSCRPAFQKHGARVAACCAAGHKAQFVRHRCQRHNASRYGPAPEHAAPNDLVGRYSRLWLAKLLEELAQAL